MQKFLIFVFAALFSFCMCGACFAAPSKSLVVYFSMAGDQYGVGVIKTGNTAIVAKMIAAETGADIFEVKPVDGKYNVPYRRLTEIAQQEHSQKARPAFAGKVPNLAAYDEIYVGAPVWWGDWPMIMYTFFEKGKPTGKTLHTFVTHEGSGLSGMDKKLASAWPGNKAGKSIAIRGTEAQNEQSATRAAIKKWLGK